MARTTSIAERIVNTMQAAGYTLTDAQAASKDEGLVLAAALNLIIGPGGVFSPLLVAGVPTSGQTGSAPGRLALDTSVTPRVVYVNVGTALVSSWMGLLSGDVV